MKIEIIKEKRKTISLKLESKDLAVVKAPLKVSNEKITEFINSKKSWIEKHVAKLAEGEEFASRFDFYKEIYQFGKVYMLTEDVAIGFASQSEVKQKKAIKKQYLSMFSTLQERVKVLAEKYNFKVNKVMPFASTCKWGTFSNKGEMRLNFKLIILPEELVDYVIIHELCHSKHMNHKPKFWAEVAKYCPEYKTLKKKLDVYTFVLKSVF